MSYPTQSAAQEDLVRVEDSWVKRFVEFFPWWFSYAMCLVCTAIVTVQAMILDEYWVPVIILAVIAVGWILMCAGWNKLAVASIADQKETLKEYEREYEYLFAYIKKMNGTMESALNSLATYDRDKAVELAEDLNAYTSKTLYDSYWRDNAHEENA